MNQYNITITSEDTGEETQMLEAFAEDIYTMQSIVDNNINSSYEVEFPYGERYITIRPYSEGGYIYDIWKSREDAHNDDIYDSEDGGLCTTTLSNAIAMAIN